MNECDSTAGGIAAAVRCILSYGGDGTDMALNYTLLLINVTSCLWLLLQPERQDRWLLRRAVLSLLFLIGFQIGLCLLVGCSGISIVWCACAGWMIRDMQLQDATTPTDASDAHLVAENSITGRGRPPSCACQHQCVTLGVSAAAILYYSVAAAPITTVAHGCAILLGMLLRGRRPSTRTRPGDDAAQPLLQDSTGVE